LENQKKLEEQNRLRMQQQQMQQQQRMEEMKRQQEELRKRQEEERQRKEAEMAQKLQEQAAALSIRRVVQKLRLVTPETFEDVQKELLEALQTHLAKCGSQAEPMKAQAESGLQQAKSRVEQILAEKRKAEEAKAEVERKRQEDIAKAQELLKQLEGLAEEAEKASKALVEEAEPLSGKEVDDMDLEELQAKAKALDQAGNDAKAKSKACTDMVLQKGPEMRAAEVPVPGQAPDEDKLTLAKLLTRINESAKLTDATLRAAKTAEAKAIKKAEAKKKLQTSESMFDKYDKNGDGMLDRREVEQFAQAEAGLKIPASYFEKNFYKSLVGDAKGVKKANFQRLKVSIGLMREQAQDDKRRETRVAREKELERLREQYQEKINDAAKEVESAEGKVSKAETDAFGLQPKAKGMLSKEMTKLADELDELVKDAREEAADAKKEVVQLTEGCEQELKLWFTSEQKKLEFKMNRFDARLQKAASLCAKFREDARRKEHEEMDALEKSVVKMLKYHQRAKDFTNEELFAAIDADKDGKIGESEWLAFFRDCEKEPKAEKEAAKEGEEEAAAAAPEEPPSEEGLTQLFAALDEDEEGMIPKERFINLVRVFMKVAKDSVLTSGASIKESKMLRRLDIGEVVEIHRGPIEEEVVKVMRVFATAKQDDLEGWITISGNQGTTFLEDGGNVFKVVTETILTECFELDGATSGAAKKVRDTTRKLKVGEIVEVRVWAKKEEKSGLMRMKCKCRADGATGWVTTVGNQGTVFLEVA